MAMMLKQLLSLEEATTKLKKIQYSKKRVKSSTGFKKLNRRSILNDSRKVLNEASESELKAKLAQLRKDLRELPSNPQSQEGYDARDEIRDEIKAVETQLAKLSKGKMTESVRTNVPEVVAYLEKFKNKIAMLPEEQAKAEIRKQIKLFFYHQIWSIDKDEWENSMDPTSQQQFVNTVYNRLQR